MIVRRRFFRRLLGGLVAAVCSPAALFAEPRKRGEKPPATPSTPEPSSSEDAPKTEEGAAELRADKAYLRLWKTSDVPDLDVRFRLLPYGKSDQEAFSPVKFEQGNYHFSEYSELSAGPFTAEISAPGAPTVQLPLHLAAGGQSTVLIRAKGSTLGAEWIDDNPASADKPLEFAVYNMLPASGDIQVDFGNLLSAHLTSTRGSTHLCGIKKGMYSASASGTDDKGKNFRWDVDVDFRQHRKITLLIYLDVYSRVRPRIVTA